MPVVFRHQICGIPGVVNEYCEKFRFCILVDMFLSSEIIFFLDVMEYKRRKFCHFMILSEISGHVPLVWKCAFMIFMVILPLAENGKIRRYDSKKKYHSTLINTFYISFALLQTESWHGEESV